MQKTKTIFPISLLNNSLDNFDIPNIVQNEKNKFIKWITSMLYLMGKNCTKKAEIVLYNPL